MNAELTNQQIRNAIQMATKLSQEKPKNTTLPMVLEQLRYLEQIYDRDGNFSAIPKGKMTFGVIAAKEEYDELFPTFADLLYKISWDLDHQEPQ